MERNSFHNPIEDLDFRLSDLPRPAEYFPIEKGIFEVAPGLKTFGTPFGNGRLDECLFQIDSDFQKFHSNKMACRAENLRKYFSTFEFDPTTRREVCLFISRRLSEESPLYFEIQENLSGGWSLNARVTGDELTFLPNGSLDVESSRSNQGFIWADGLDALACQIQEDLAVLTVTPDKKNFLSAIHVCAPAHWAPDQKIGKDFFAIHAPIPGIQKINSASQHFSEAMVRKGPFVRFVWGFATDTQLNHHPIAPTGVSQEAWSGRKFSDPRNSQFYLRIERQVTWGLPHVSAALFTIRVSFIPGEDIKKNPLRRGLLKSALEGMSPDILAYKGLSGSIGPLLGWLADDRK